jgi:hypothetical protein
MSGVRRAATTRSLLRPAVLLLAAPLVAVVGLAGLLLAEVRTGRLPAAHAEISDRLDELAGDPACTKWWGSDPGKMEKLRGRVVLVHFSRPEVITSRAALLSLRKFAERWKDAAVTIVEIVVSDEVSAAESYVAKESPPWSVGFDGNGLSSARYPGDSVPRSYLVGPDGRIVWHAHLGALQEKVVEEQLNRVALFSPPAGLKTAKAAARAAAEMRFGAAMDEAGKVEVSPQSTPEDKAVAKAVRDEMKRAYTFLRARADALYEGRDYGICMRRLDRMLVCFKGTQYEREIAARIAELNRIEIVPFVVKGQDELEAIEALPTRTKKQLTDAIARLRTFLGRYGDTIPGDRGEALLKVLEERAAAAK